MINKTIDHLSRFFLLTIFLLFFSPIKSEAQQSVEQSLVKHIDQHQDSAMALLEQVVNINSGTLNFEGVKKIGDIFRKKFTALGFETRWVDGTPFQRSGHLVAEHAGKGPRLLLIGHLDTVFEKDSPFQRFQVIDDSTASGPGIGDMKGGDVIIVQALLALHEVGVLKNMNITVVMTGDEERSGRPLDLARKDLIEAAEAADIAIGFENGDGDPTTAIVTRRGSTGWTLRVKGKPAHSSQIFREDVGAGAIYEAARILNAFYQELAGEQYLTFNPGLILGGTDVDYEASRARGSAFGKNNVVAGQVVVSGDLRTISPAQLERAKATMQAIVSRHRPQTSAELKFRDSYPPLAPTAGNRRLLAIFDQVSRDLGFGPVTEVDPMRAGAADVSFTAGHVEMAIDGLGLGGADDHTVNETGDLRTLPMQTKRAAVLLYRLSKIKKE